LIQISIDPYFCHSSRILGGIKCVHLQNICQGSEWIDFCSWRGLTFISPLMMKSTGSLHLGIAVWWDIGDCGPIYIRYFFISHNSSYDSRNIHLFMWCLVHPSCFQRERSGEQPFKNGFHPSVFINTPQLMQNLDTTMKWFY